MTFQQIKDVANSAPFQPFALETTGGQKISVEHPDYIFFGPDGHTVIIFTKPRDTVRLASAQHVASMEIRTPENIR